MNFKLMNSKDPEFETSLSQMDCQPFG